MLSLSLLLVLFISFIFIIRKKEKEKKKEEEKDFISRGFVTVFGISDPTTPKGTKIMEKSLKSVKNVKMVLIRKIKGERD